MVQLILHSLRDGATADAESKHSSNTLAVTRLLTDPSHKLLIGSYEHECTHAHVGMGGRPVQGVRAEPRGSELQFCLPQC